jgi:hypothetical protein
MKAVLNGDLEHAKLNKDSIKVAENATKIMDVKVSERELRLREEVQKLTQKKPKK